MVNSPLLNFNYELIKVELTFDMHIVHVICQSHRHSLPFTVTSSQASKVPTNSYI